MNISVHNGRWSRGTTRSEMFVAVTMGIAVALCGSGQVRAREAVQPVLKEGEQRLKEGQTAQQQVQAVAGDIDKLLQEYRTINKEIYGLNVYNVLLQKQVDNQQLEIDNLQDSISRVALVERQITPLMVRMLDSLEMFVRLDTPFLLQEREMRVQRLHAMLERADVSAAEKLRRIIEAYQIENEYGRTLEAYKGSLEVAGIEREVDFLRIGRVALMYQSVGGEFSGVWRDGAWQTLSPVVYKQTIAKGLRVARKQVAPDLLWVPVPVATESGS